MSTNSEIQALVADFTSKLTLIVRRSTLQEMIATLGGASAAPKRGPGRPAGAPRKAGRPAKRGRRSSSGVDEGALLDYVTKNSGQGANMIADAMKTSVDALRPTMQKLIAAKKVKVKGQKRGTKYFAA